MKKLKERKQVENLNTMVTFFTHVLFVAKPAYTNIFCLILFLVWGSQFKIAGPKT